ncbi:HEAT repeat domain-containing protein [Flammeovirga kamogawensis]|uniref:HEAT repeat domain-containing protein n=1 Tax=Flammeovirga kamogawensis TaxID=373891 RepID=A0ABX8H398_9BACT|nr:HEAT repeat domain-containing protein [Flammeovirga kamogawensis]MBB6464111.1 hypothetical protein [Flammeovirga kamogawensis]QWG09891.1 hypothetical protein KM029_19615 [Flammeovirga kamogawensis]TRX65395.1 hypothetical protein EO216_23010 [Flammeovirga kamogawensis]
MNLEELKDILRNEGTFATKTKAISDSSLELLNLEIFNILFELLEDDDSQNRFFAIFHLIDKFSDLLTNLDESLVNKVYNALFDEDSPVADRAIWALNIIGDRALDKLINEFHTGTIENKIRITYAIGRGNFSIRTLDRIEILFNGLKSKDEELRFTAMCEMMSNSPVGPWSENEWNSTKDENIDFEKIYDIVLPIAYSFSTSENESYKEFSIRYIDWIEKRKSL